MLRITKIYLVTLLLLPLFGISQDTIAYMYTFGGANNDRAEDVESTMDGGYIVVGATSSNSYGNTDVYLLKIDSMCNYEWSFALGGTNNDWGYSVKQTYDKGFIIAVSSNSYGNGGYDAVLMKRDSTGKHQWTKKYGGNDWDFAYSVVQTYDSGFVFCGETYNNTSGFSDVYIVKTDVFGDTLWTRTIGGSMIDKGNVVIEASDSSIVVAGLRNTISDSTQAYLLKLSADGVLILDSLYGGVGYEDFKGIVETNDGGFALTGTINTSNDKDYYVVRTNKDASVLWGQVVANSGDEEGFDVFELANGNLMITGYIEAFGGGGRDGYWFRLNPGGWWVDGSTFGGSLNDGFSSMNFGLNGQLVLAGTTRSFGNGKEDVLLVRLDTIYEGMDTVMLNNKDSIPLEINKTEDKVLMGVFPNPFESFLYVNIEGLGYKNISIEIVDLYGRLFFAEVINSNSNKLDLKRLSDGIYFLKVKVGGQTIKVEKLLKIGD